VLRLRLILSSLSAMALLASESIAHADEPSQSSGDLEAVLAQQVVTTASQTAETKATAPATTSVITAEDIHRHGIRTLNEALNFLSLGMFTTHRQPASEPGARGVLLSTDYGNHILLLIDGHGVNEPYGGSASFDRGLGVPIEIIDHIEVILGPGAVLYGSNAMLGVVNVVTKKGKDYRGVHAVADGEVDIWGKLGVGVGTDTKLFGRELQVSAAVEYQHLDGPRFIFAPQEYGVDSVTGQPKRFSALGAGTGVWGGAGRPRARAPGAYLRVISGNLDVAVRASSFDRTAPFLDNFINPYGDMNRAGTYELERWFSADIKYRIPVSTLFDLRTRVYTDAYNYDWYNKTSAAEDCFDGQLDGCNRNLRARSRWVGSEVRGKFDWLKTNQLVTMVGVDARYETVRAASTVTPGGQGDTVVAGNVDIGNLRMGVYGQQIASPWHWLTLNAGARIDVAEGYPGALSPRAMAGVTPWKGSMLKAIYTQAFRAPSSYEREWADPFALRSPNLRPEHEDSVEGSFEQQLGAHRLLIGAFHTNWKDIVTAYSLTEDEIAAAIAAGAPLAGGYAFQYRNQARINNYGFNGAIDGSFLSRKLRYGLNLTGAKSRRLEGDGSEAAPLSHTPTFYGNARTSYDFGGSLPTVAVAAQFSGRRPADGGFTPTPYAPPVLEMRAAVSGPVPFLPGLSYRVTANYAFQPTGSYTIGPIQDSSYGVAPTLNPVDRFRVGVGLQYVWDP
jgi:outer membrane receptor for ferrienterochelin and colicins